MIRPFTLILWECVSSKFRKWLLQIKSKDENLFSRYIISTVDMFRKFCEIFKYSCLWMNIEFMFSENTSTQRTFRLNYSWSCRSNSRSGGSSPPVRYVKIFFSWMTPTFQDIFWKIFSMQMRHFFSGRRILRLVLLYIYAKIIWNPYFQNPNIVSMQAENKWKIPRNVHSSTRC